MIFTATLNKLLHSVDRLRFQEACRVGSLWHQKYVSHLCSPVVFNGCSKDAFAKLKASSILLSKDNSTARSGGAVLKGYGDVRLHLICNQYLLDSCRQTLGLFVIHYHIVDGFGTNSSSQNSYHLILYSTRKSGQLNGIWWYIIGSGDAGFIVHSTLECGLNVLYIPFCKGYDGD